MKINKSVIKRVHKDNVSAQRDLKAGVASATPSQGQTSLVVGRLVGVCKHGLRLSFI